MLTKRRNLVHYGLPVGGFRFVADIKLYDEALGLHGIATVPCLQKTVLYFLWNSR